MVYLHKGGLVEFAENLGQGQGVLLRPSSGQALSPSPKLRINSAKGLGQWGYPEDVETPPQILRRFAPQNDILGKTQSRCSRLLKV